VLLTGETPAAPWNYLVAATARACGLKILHYDRDFDTIARFTEQPARWIVPPGTV
jgi:predicted nucleic acid-binding protein